MFVSALTLFVKKHCQMKHILLLCTIAFSSVVSANTYYVATSGNDRNPGTKTQPWASWQKGFESARAGDTVFIRGGIYYPTTYSYLNSVVYLSQGYGGTQIVGNTGSPGNPICFWAYPPDYENGNLPILDCKNINPGIPGAEEQRYSQAIVLFAVDFLHFKGLTIRNLYQRYSNVYTQAIYAIGCSNLTFENMAVHNIGGRALASFQDVNYTASRRPGLDYDTTRFINCDHYHLCDSLDPDPSYKHENPRTSVVAGLSDGFKVQMTQRGVMRFEGCRIWHFSDDGIDFNGEGLLEVMNCWVFRGGDFSFTNSDGTYVRGEEGNGFKFGAMSVNLDNSIITRRFYNNISAYNEGIGYNVNNSGGTAYYDINGELYNNISYRDRVSFGNFTTHPTDIPYSLKIFNNISYLARIYPRGNEWSELGSKSIIEGYNSWCDNDYNWNVNRIPACERIEIRNNDFISLDSTQLYRPRKSDGSLPDITFLKLAPTSDAIDAGVDVGLPYYGSAPDIGYAEFKSGTSTPAKPVFLTGIIENATPTKLEMTYNLPLTNITPATTVFTVRVNSTNRSVTSVAVSERKVTLTLASPVVHGDIVTVAYTKPETNSLQTAEGGQAESLTTQNVTNKVAPPAPEYISSVIENATPAKLEITYNLALANITPATTAFTVRVNSTTRTVSSVSISGTKVTLTLATPVVYDDIVTVAYKKPATNWLQTVAGGQAEPIPAQNVLNNCRMPANQPPVANISSPAKNNTFTAPATINIEATANDPDGTIIKIEFYNGEIKLGEVLNKPYSFTWKDVAEGTYFISVAAIDNKNVRAVSDPVVVIVNAAAIDTLGTISQTSEIELSMLDTKIPGFGIINLYPNPSDGHFTVDMSGVAEHDRKFTIYNLSGQALINEKESGHGVSLDFNYPGLPAGIYVLTVSCKNKITDSRTIIKR